MAVIRIFSLLCWASCTLSRFQPTHRNDHRKRQSHWLWLTMVVLHRTVGMVDIMAVALATKYSLRMKFWHCKKFRMAAPRCDSCYDSRPTTNQQKFRGTQKMHWSHDTDILTDGEFAFLTKIYSKGERESKPPPPKHLCGSQKKRKLCYAHIMTS